MPTQSAPPEEAAAAERFSIDELSTLAGLTPRTVRYYIAEGLVDCQRQSKFDPPCQTNIDPGMDADGGMVGWG